MSAEHFVSDWIFLTRVREIIAAEQSLETAEARLRRDGPIADDADLRQLREDVQQRGVALTSVWRRLLEQVST